MFDKENWSAQKFNWLYAMAMVIAIISLAFLLLHFNLIKTINLRFIYIPVIFLGMILFMRDYAKHTVPSYNYCPWMPKKHCRGRVPKAGPEEHVFSV